MNQYANDFTNVVVDYYNDLKKCRPLSKGRERKLLKKCQKGDVEARKEILESNLRFVFNIARRYTGRGVSISDLISEGNMGLLKAIDKFDYNRNVRFISYAVWWIRQSMLSLINHKRCIEFVEIEPNVEISDAMEQMIVEDDDDFMHSCNENTMYSDEDCTLENERKEMQCKLVTKILASLDEREREIIEAFYGLKDGKELTLIEISKKYNLSSERVRQIKAIAVRKLRSQLLLEDNLSEII